MNWKISEIVFQLVPLHAKPTLCQYYAANKQELCCLIDLDTDSAAALKGLCSWAYFLLSEPHLSHLQNRMTTHISQIAMKTEGGHLHTTCRSSRSGSRGASCSHQELTYFGFTLHISEFVICLFSH